MIKKLKPKSEFSKNVLTLITGTTIALLIPIAISPILTRIYTPEDFGLLGLFVAVTTILGNIVNGKYELAIMIPKKDENAMNIFTLGLIINSIVSILLLALVLLFDESFAKLLGNEDILFWLYFMPITIFFIGLFTLLRYFNNRFKNYKDIANSTVVKSFAMAIVQLSVGLIKKGAMGLILGQIASQVFSNFNLIKNVLKKKVLLSKVSGIKMWALAKKYKNFPKFLILANGISSLTSQAPLILLAILFNSSVIGFLFLTQRVIGLPMSIVARSIGDVFREEAVSMYKKNSECLSIYKSTFKKLFLLSIIPFSIILFFAPFLFSFVFGKEWEIAGVYAQILTPMYFLQFITNPLSNMFIIAEKQKLNLYWQSTLLISVVSSLFIGKYIFDDSLISIALFSLSYSIAYIINGFMSYHFAKGKI